MPAVKNQIEYTCANCGKQWMAKISRKARFCSAECVAEYRANRHYWAKCPECGLEFLAYKSYPRIYCSVSCATTARNKTDANPSFHRDISGANNPMYGRGSNGKDNGMFGKKRELNPAWRGGRKIRADGYVLIMAPDDHPYRLDGGYILEHRLLMEKHLGRYLDPKEVVHHIDGNPSHNTIDNLRLYPDQATHIHDGHPKHGIAR